MESSGTPTYFVITSRVIIWHSSLALQRRLQVFQRLGQSGPPSPGPNITFLSGAPLAIGRLQFRGAV